MQKYMADKEWEIRWKPQKRKVPNQIKEIEEQILQFHPCNDKTVSLSNLAVKTQGSNTPGSLAESWVLDPRSGTHFQALLKSENEAVFPPHLGQL